MNVMFLTDGYKLDHRRQYPKGTEYIQANWTPRSCSNYKEAEEGVVVFGIHYVLKRITELFQDFFKAKESSKEYMDFVNRYLEYNEVGGEHIKELHEYGKLPLLFKHLPEGELCPIGVPMLTVENTDPKFFWLVNYIETLLSNMLWLPMTSATTARLYKKNLKEHSDKVGIDVNPFLCHDFSMRGMAGIDSTILSGMGHLTSFTGSESIPAIIEIKKYYYSEDILIASTVPACYSDDTEILTSKGWKFFSELNENDLVAQYNEDGSIEFVIPTNYYKDPYKGKMIHFAQECKGSKIDLLVTPNHRMIRRYVSSMRLEMFEANEALSDISYTPNRLLITSGTIKKVDKMGLTPLDKLKIAFQADGSLPSHSEDYNGKYTNTYPIRFSLKKDRKMDRLEKLFAEANVKYTKNKYENGYYSIWANMPEKFSKEFDWVDLNNMSLQECCDFIEELQYWDGCKKNQTIVYSSTNKRSIDIVQAVANICGYRTTVNFYQDKRTDYNRKLTWRINITKGEKYGIAKYLRVSEVDYDGYVYCVSVPSKMLVVRRNNKSLICGNTEHSVMCAGTKENEIDTYKRLITEVYPKGYISIVSDTWDLWKVLTEYTVELKEEILARDGRVVFRPDSGNPVDIICGIDTSKFRDFDAGIDETYSDEDVKNIASYGFIGDVGEIIKMSNRYWIITKINSNNSIKEVEQLPEHIIKGAYEILWDIFGGHINDKGYKVLNDKVGLIYGDAITLERQKEIYKRLEEKSFSASNLVLGIGSFTYQFKTRDSLGFAMKSTWCQVNGVSQPIFKNPITDNGTKKSAIGKVDVIKVNGVYKLKDENNYSTDNYKSELIEFNPNNLVQLKDIRDRIDKGL